MTENLMSLNDAALWGIERVRNPKWLNPLDHIKLHVSYGSLGPWLYLWAPANTMCNGRDPVELLFLSLDLDEAAYEPYTGPLPDTEEYRAAVERVNRAQGAVTKREET